MGKNTPRVWSVSYTHLVFLAVKNRNGQEILLDTLLLILGAKEIASEKLIRVYTVTIATALFVTIGASLLGIIENLSYAQPGSCLLYTSRCV